MADRINFANKINDSVQVGDELHVTNPYAGAVTSFSVGSITAIGEYYVEVNTAPSMTGGATLQNTFYMFKKVNHTSGGVSSYSKSGTKGYSRRPSFRPKR